MPTKKINVKAMLQKMQSNDRRKRKTSNLPRKTIATGANSAPNSYNFTRSHTYPVTLGVADATHNVYLNTDSTYMIIKLREKAGNLTNFSDFETLFSEFKITSFKQVLTPYYKVNIGYADRVGSDTNAQRAIPNYEIIILPVNSSVEQANFTNSSGTQIQDFLDQSQRKGKRLMPSGVHTFWTKKPMCSEGGSHPNKDATNVMPVMKTPNWLPTGTNPAAPSFPLGTSIEHYGKVVLIRRVDGRALTPDPGVDPRTTAQMGFRMTSQVYFKCRKVQ